LAAIVAVLLLAAAGLLVLGVLLERHTESGSAHPIVATTGEQQERQHDESTGETHAESGVPATGGAETAQRLTGINVESPLIVTLGAIASVAVAAAVWLRPNRPVIAIVVAFTAAALVLDVLETSHQLGAGRIGLAALAGVIASLRVAVIVGSGYLYRAATGAR
jgi:Flp pilus assembly protein TadB